MVLNLKRIKAERIAKGLTQEDVSEKMGWKTRSPYAKRENGIIPMGADELGKIALIFGYTEDDLGIFFKKDVPFRERKIKQYI